MAHIERVLRSYGILTRARLCEFAGAERWPQSFDSALASAVRAGRIRALGADLYEVMPPR